MGWGCHLNARIMLNAFASLKCSKKCQHNVQKPRQKSVHCGQIMFSTPRCESDDVFSSRFGTSLKSFQYDHFLAYQTNCILGRYKTL